MHEGFSLRPRVLIIDDEPMVRLTLAAFLEDSGFACLETGSGREGLETLDREQPDLVLTDLQMEGLDGFAVVRAVAHFSPQTPVIVMTGTEDPHTTEQLLNLGARHCFPKPIRDLRKLTFAIHACLKAGEQK